MTDHVGWQSYWWLNFALSAAALLVDIGLFPETRWHRDPSTEGASNGPHMILDDHLSTFNTSDTTSKPSRTHIENYHIDSHLGKGSPSREQFQLLFPVEHPLRTLCVEIFWPLRLFFYPIVAFAAFTVAMCAGLQLVVNLTQSQIFAVAPYNFSSDGVGLLNIAMIVGITLGLISNGPLSDWLSMRATYKNKGIREPEMRLPTMIPYLSLVILSCFIIAYGYHKFWDWKVRATIINHVCNG